MPIKAAGALTYELGVGEKGRHQIEIDVKGVSAHASIPWQGTNALYRLAQVLGRIEAYEPERDTSMSLFEHLATFVDVVADTMDIDDVERMQFAWLALGQWRATLALGYAKSRKDSPFAGWLECLDEFVEPEFNKLLEMIREHLNGELEKKPILLN